MADRWRGTPDAWKRFFLSNVTLNGKEYSKFRMILSCLLTMNSATNDRRTIIDEMMTREKLQLWGDEVQRVIATIKKFLPDFFIGIPEDQKGKIDEGLAIKHAVRIIRNGWKIDEIVNQRLEAVANKVNERENEIEELEELEEDEEFPEPELG